MSMPTQVRRYRAELDAALLERGIPDREQVVQQVTEHIDQALAELASPTERDISAVLADLGDPLAIADEAAATAPTRQPVPPRTSALQGSWLPPLALTLFVMAEVATLAPLIWQPVQSDGLLTEAFFRLLYNPFWWASLALVVISPLFRPTERIAWAVILPLTAAIVPPVVRDLFNSPYPIDAALGHLVAFGTPVLAAALATWLTIRARHRSSHTSKPSGASTAQQQARYRAPKDERG